MTTFVRSSRRRVQNSRCVRLSVVCKQNAERRSSSARSLALESLTLPTSLAADRQSQPPQPPPARRCFDAADATDKASATGARAAAAKSASLLRSFSRHGGGILPASLRWRFTLGAGGAQAPPNRGQAPKFNRTLDTLWSVDSPNN